MAEEFIRLRKSKPAVLAAGIIWAHTALVYVGQWLRVTLTAGVGGSMLSIGSATGEAGAGAMK